MKRSDNDKLKALFGEIKPQDPSVGFHSALMSRIRKESAVRSWLYMLLLPVVGIAIMIGIFLMVIPYLAPNLDLASLLSKFNFALFNWSYAVIPGSVLLLLVADTLIRKHLRKKHSDLRNML